MYVCMYVYKYEAIFHASLSLSIGILMIVLHSTTTTILKARALLWL